MGGGHSLPYVAHHHHHHHLPRLVGPDHSNYLRALQQSALWVYIPSNWLLSWRNTAGSVVYLLQLRIITSCDNIAGSSGVQLPLLKYPRTRKIKTLETMGFGQELRIGYQARSPPPTPTRATEEVFGESRRDSIE